MDDVLLSEADGTCQQVPGPNEYSVEGQFGSTYPDGTRTFELSIRSQEDGSEMLILTAGTLHRNGSINGDLFTADHAAHARVHFEPVDSGLVASSSPTPSPAVITAEPTLAPSPTPDDGLIDAEQPTTMLRVIAGVGAPLGSVEDVRAWERAFDESLRSAARTMALAEWLVGTDVANTSFEEFQSRLKLAQRSAEVSAAHADALDRIGQKLLDRQESKAGQTALKRTAAALLEKAGQPALASKPQRIGGLRTPSQDVRELLSASYNDVRALREAIRIARRLGFSSRFIGAQLRALEGEVKAEAFRDEAVTHAWLDNRGTIIKAGSQLVFFALSVVASGGGTAVTTLGVAAEGAATLISGVSTATSVAEDVLYVALGPDDGPVALPGIKGAADILSLVNLTNITDPTAAVSGIFWIGGKLGAALDQHLANHTYVDIRPPLDLDVPVLEFEELSEDDFPAFPDEIGDPPQFEELSDDEFAQFLDEIDAPIEFEELSEEEFAKYVDEIGPPDEFEELSDEEFARFLDDSGAPTAPRRPRQLAAVGVPPYEFPPGLALGSFVDGGRDRGRQVFVGEVENTSRVVHRATPARAFLAGDPRRESAGSPRFVADWIFPGESAVLRVAGVPEGVTAGELQLSMNSPSAARWVEPVRGVLTVVDTLFARDHRGDYEIHARVGRLKGEGEFAVLIAAFDDSGQAIWEGFAGHTETGVETGWPPAVGHSTIFRTAVPADIAEKVAFYRVLAHERVPVAPAANGARSEVGWTVAYGQGFSVLDVSVRFEVVPTPYWGTSGYPFLDGNGQIAAIVSGEVRNDSDANVWIVGGLSFQWPNGRMTGAHPAEQIIEPGESRPFVTTLAETDAAEMIPGYAHTSPDAVIPSYPLPAFVGVGQGSVLTLKRPIDPSWVSVRFGSPRAIELVGRSKGYTYFSWDTTVRNETGLPLDFFASAALASGGTVVALAPIPSRGDRPGLSVQGELDGGRPFKGSPTILRVYFSGTCRICPEQLPGDRDLGGPVQDPGPDVDLLCGKMVTEGGYNVCQGMVEALAGRGEVDSATAQLEAKTCDGLRGEQRDLCRVVVAVETGDKRQLEGVTDDLALLLYIQMTGDLSVRERLSTDAHRDSALILALVARISADNLPATSYCDDLLVRDLQDEDNSTFVCEASLRLVRAIVSDDASECDALLHTLVESTEAVSAGFTREEQRVNAEEDRFNMVFECKQVLQDFRTLSAFGE